MLDMLYQTVVTSGLFYAVVCWGVRTKKKGTLRLDKVIQKVGSVVGAQLESLTSVADARTLNKI